MSKQLHRITTFYFFATILVGSVGDIIKIYTEEKFGYIYLNNFGVDVKKMSHIAFSIRARNDAHVALSKFENNPGFETYEVVIGGWNNQKSVIRKCSQCRPMTSLDGEVLNGSEFRRFWVSWDDAYLRVGEGSAPYEDEMMSWWDPDPHLVNYLAVSTGWGSNGTWVFNFVDGGWSAWVTWSDCSTTCSNGTRMRVRYCDNPSPIYGAPCEGPAEETGSCNHGPCPVNGGWSDWSPWEACSVSCDQGTSRRHRSCDQPEPQYGGLPCSGDMEEITVCNERECPINGAWSSWLEWSACDVTCANGLRTRKRHCDNPAPDFGGMECSGADTMSESCFGGYCPVDGLWSSWSVWSTCSQTCGGGWQSRWRACDSPAPEYGGRQCQGNGDEIRTCNVEHCPVDGAWSEWSAWTTCSASCGGGGQRRYRKCDDPTPAYGGAECEGEANEKATCEESPCPVDGVWLSWQPWSACSVTCAGGRQRRFRECDAPKYGGEPCSGNDVEFRPCADRPCPVDGAWSEWSQWDECSVTCSDGTTTRRRKCDSPAPAHGGRPCVGVDYESGPCFVNECPVDGQWSLWSQWNQCSKTCSEGYVTRSRTCDNPAPKYGGLPCEGDDTETETCLVRECPVDGGWSSWGDWTKCSLTCGWGFTARQRACDNPAPLNGGEYCLGLTEERTNCFIMECPIDGSWSQWSPWSQCTQTCNGGSRQRIRRCNNPLPQFGGLDCVGDDWQNITCMEEPCPVDGMWSPWTRWRPCSAPCNGGYTYKNRTCDNPPPAYGGLPCSGREILNRSCNMQQCDDKDRFVLQDDEPMEAPGAIGIGIIGLAVVFTMLAAFVVMDLLTIHRHFAFMKTNLQHFWARVKGKQPPPPKRKPRSRKLRSTTKKRSKRGPSVKPAVTSGAGYDPEVTSDYVPVMMSDVVPLAGVDDVNVRLENERILSNNINIPHQNDLNKETNFNTMARKKLESKYREVVDTDQVQLQATQL